MFVAGAIAVGGVGSAAAAELADLDGSINPVEVDVALERNHLERSLETVELRNGYKRAYAKAEKLDVAPGRELPKRADSDRLERELKRLRKEIRQAERKSEREPDVGSPTEVGVSKGTLEAIAACESGGDAGAVSSDGTYRGKYQFDHGTWASVGGSGDPAAAPEREQDYRAAVLYSRSGSSPWPVCG
jgi:soluble lytic murein transglycosylase-like protein